MCHLCGYPISFEVINHNDSLTDIDGYSFTSIFKHQNDITSTLTFIRGEPGTSLISRETIKISSSSFEYTINDFKSIFLNSNLLHSFKTDIKGWNGMISNVISQYNGNSCPNLATLEDGIKNLRLCLSIDSRLCTNEK